MMIVSYLFFNDRWVTKISFNKYHRVTEFSDNQTALSGLAPLIEKSYYAGKSDRTSDERM